MFRLGLKTVGAGGLKLKSKLGDHGANGEGGGRGTA